MMAQCVKDMKMAENHYNQDGPRMMKLGQKDGQIFSQVGHEWHFIIT